MKYDKNVFRSFTMIVQFGLNMLVPIFLCFFIGLYIDHKIGTSYISVVLFFLGVFAGFRNVYLFAKKIYETKESRDEKIKRNE